jgi:hypothetical protein
MDRNDNDDDNNSNSDDGDSDDLDAEEEEYEPFSAIVEVDVNDFAPGLRELEAFGRRAVPDGEPLSVSLPDDYCLPQAPTEAETQLLRRRFARFVTVLDRDCREGIREVGFFGVQFDEPSLEFDQADLARLFGEVLPSLPHLERVHFCCYPLPVAVLGRFASKLSVVTSSLVDLDIDECIGDFAACVPAVAAMIRRNASIQDLRLCPVERMDRDACREIFNSLQHNSNLRYLDVRVDQVYDDALILPKHPMSSLRRLVIRVQKWTRKGKSSLANQLKISTAVEDLRIVYAQQPGRALSHRPWIETLTTHNASLRHLAERNDRDPLLFDTGITDERVAALLRRNGRIQQGLDRLQDYHVSPPVLVPRVLGLVSTLPALLYQFLRRGDVNVLVDLLLLVARNPPPPAPQPPSTQRRNRTDDRKKKRSRPPPLRRSSRLRK